MGDELIFIVEGANAGESGVVATGNMNYRPKGCVHTVTTKNGATVLAAPWYAFSAPYEDVTLKGR